MQELNAVRWGPREGRAEMLVLLVHGLGADGHDLIDIGPSWAAALPQAAFAAPDGPEPCDMGPTGRQWFSLQDRSPARMLAGVAGAAAALGRFVAAELTRLELPGDAWALMGFSQGAMTVLQLGLHASQAGLAPPRAVLAYSGRLVDQVVPQGPLPPVLLVHGEADTVVPVAGTEKAAAVLEAAGAQVQTVISPGLEHGIDDAGLAMGALFLQRAFSETA
jgi:phospholipase/carboxylesterase